MIPDENDSWHDWFRPTHCFLNISGRMYSYPYGVHDYSSYKKHRLKKHKKDYWDEYDKFNHHTLRCWEIRVDKCTSCEEFESCLKKLDWGNLENNYDYIGHNCCRFSRMALRKCGGHIKNFMTD